jgi:hypothetical protein
MQSKIEELEKIIKYAKENKILKLEMGEIKIELHPSAFQMSDPDDKDVSPVDKLTPEELEMVKQKLVKDSDEILFWSANN